MLSLSTVQVKVADESDITLITTSNLGAERFDQCTATKFKRAGPSVFSGTCKGFLDFDTN